MMQDNGRLSQIVDHIELLYERGQTEQFLKSSKELKAFLLDMKAKRDATVPEEKAYVRLMDLLDKHAEAQAMQQQTNNQTPLHSHRYRVVGHIDAMEKSAPGYSSVGVAIGIRQQIQQKKYDAALKSVNTWMDRCSDKITMNRYGYIAAMMCNDMQAAAKFESFLAQHARSELIIKYPIALLHAIKARDWQAADDVMHTLTHQLNSGERKALANNYSEYNRGYAVLPSANNLCGAIFEHLENKHGRLSAAEKKTALELCHAIVKLLPVKNTTIERFNEKAKAAKASGLLEEDLTLSDGWRAEVENYRQSSGRKKGR